MTTRLPLLTLLLVGAGCRTELFALPDAAVPSCATDPGLICVRREAGPCSRLVQVAAVCEHDSARCPDGSRPYRPAPDFTSCRPFYPEGPSEGGGGPFTRLDSAGLTVETDDGRCLQLPHHAVLRDGSVVEWPGLYLDDAQPTNTCPDAASFIAGPDGKPRSVVDASALGDGEIPSLRSSALRQGASLVFFRRYALDAAQVFGVRNLGSAVSVWNSGSETLRLHGDLLFPITDESGDLGIDFGDAAVLDGGALYLLGCGGPPRFLSYDCQLARLTASAADDPASWAFFDGRAFTSQREHAATLFESGPERAALFHGADGRWVHLYIVGFGTRVELRTAPALTGPWSGGTPLIDCELPADDEHAYCAGVAVRPELFDPLRPRQIVVQYDVNTLADDAEPRRAARPADYWPRLVRVELP